jgi:hypothetical protein
VICTTYVDCTRSPQDKLAEDRALREDLKFKQFLTDFGVGRWKQEMSKVHPGLMQQFPYVKQQVERIEYKLEHHPKLNPIEANYEGTFGMVFQLTKYGYIQILHCMPQSPSWSLGFKPLWEIREVSVSVYRTRLFIWTIESSHDYHLIRPEIEVL